MKPQKNQEELLANQIIKAHGWIREEINELKKRVPQLEEIDSLDEIQGEHRKDAEERLWYIFALGSCHVPHLKHRLENAPLAKNHSEESHSEKTHIYMEGGKKNYYEPMYEELHGKITQLIGVSDVPDDLYKFVCEFFHYYTDFDEDDYLTDGYPNYYWACHFYEKEKTEHSDFYKEFFIPEFMDDAYGWYTDDAYGSLQGGDTNSYGYNIHIPTYERIARDRRYYSCLVRFCATLDPAEIQPKVPQAKEIFNEIIRVSREKYKSLLGGITSQMYMVGDEDHEERVKERKEREKKLIREGEEEIKRLKIEKIDMEPEKVMARIALAKEIISKPYFNPDRWIENEKDIPMLIVEKPNCGSDVLKFPIRWRLEEIRRSYIMGNYMATISTTRSLLEYAIKHKLLTKNEWKEHRKLGELISMAQGKHPELEESMNTIRIHGNYIMHPDRDHARRSKEFAKQCINEITNILNVLYSADTPSRGPKE